VQRAGVFAAVLLGLRLFGFEFGLLSGLRGSSFLFRLIQFGNRHKHRKLGQPVLGSLIAGSDEDFGIEVRIGIIGDLAQCKGVFVAVVGDDVNVRGRVRRFGLDADEARSHMAAVEDPVHRVAGEDVGDFLLVGQNDERRLQQARRESAAAYPLPTP
jgi:hypothetical protein